MKKLLVIAFATLLFSNMAYAASNADVAKWKKEGNWHETQSHHSNTFLSFFLKTISQGLQHAALVEKAKIAGALSTARIAGTRYVRFAGPPVPPEQAAQPNQNPMRDVNAHINRETARINEQAQQRLALRRVVQLQRLAENFDEAATAEAAANVAVEVSVISILTGSLGF